MLIGGGSAVMGLVSIVEELLHDEEGLKIPAIKLFHSNRSNEDIPFYTRMSDFASQNKNFHYFPYITGQLDSDEIALGHLGRMNVQHLAQELAGIRLFCICGSGVFSQAIANMLFDLDVWPGSSRTDYTTRVDPSRRLDKMKTLNSGGRNQHTKRFESCTDGMKEKGGDMNARNDYLTTYGINALLQNLSKRLAEEKPQYPLDFLSCAILHARTKLPEVTNIKAADPEFGINYWETDNVPWQC